MSRRHAMIMIRIKTRLEFRLQALVASRNPFGFMLRFRAKDTT
jgi:hypothetical protein